MQWNLHFDWPIEQQCECPKSKLHDRFLRPKPPPPGQGYHFSQTFTPRCQSHGENHIHPVSSTNPNLTNYSNVLGLRDHGYGRFHG